MNLSLKKFQIFRSGTHHDSIGRAVSFSDETLMYITEEYNGRKQQGARLAPLFIGHGNGTRKKGELPKGLRPLGLIDSIEFEQASGKLYANAYVTDELVELVRKGVYKKVSAGFDSDEKKYTLNHVAFLNNPAVKGMDALEFGESMESFDFAQAAEMQTREETEDPNAEYYQPAAYAMHKQILSYQSAHGGSYESAFSAISRQNALKRQIGKE